MSEKTDKWIKAAKKIGIVLLWVSMLSLVFIALEFSNSKSHSNKCQKVLISIYPIDIHFYNRQRVLEDIKSGLNRNQKLLGSEMGDLNIPKLEKSLQEKPLVESAEVFSNLEGEINIKVQQRKPILRVIRYDGTQYYIDQYGIKMPLSEHFTAHVPIANGNIFERYERGDSVYSFVGNQLFKIASFVDKQPFYKALIEQIFVRADNELILVPTVGSQFIVFGDANEPEKKFRKLLVFYQEGLNRTGWNKYKSIDLRFEGQVICKK
jgi:cell division protein FtsQ